MRFADLVAVSDRVAATRSRLAKLRELAQCLRTLSPDEIEMGVLWLAGETRQGKIGIGYSVLQQSAPAAPASLAASAAFSASSLRQRRTFWLCSSSVSAKTWPPVPSATK